MSKNSNYKHSGEDSSRIITDIKDAQGDTPESWAVDWENFKCAMILGEKYCFEFCCF
jgi:hypothetical protein